MLNIDALFLFGSPLGFSLGDPHQFEQKFNYRRPMYPILKYMWGQDNYRDSIKARSFRLCSPSYTSLLGENGAEPRPTGVILTAADRHPSRPPAAIGRLCRGEPGGHESAPFPQVPEPVDERRHLPA